MRKFLQYCISQIKLSLSKIFGIVFSLIKPKSQTEDSIRKEFILNILLLTSITLSSVAFLLIFYGYITKTHIRGVSPFFAFSILFIFSVLFILSRKGDFIVSSYILIWIYFVSSTYCIYKWGIDLPLSLITYILIIILSGILINTKYSFKMTSLVSITLLLFAYLQNNYITHPNLYWKTEMLRIDDAIFIITTFIVITIVSWLSNREIEKSLWRARKSEKELMGERDSLEIKVTERTRELKRVQEEKALQMYRSSEFGRMAFGLFHDLVNPLTAVSLNIEGARRGKDFDVTELDLNKIAESIKHTKQLLNAARKQMRDQELELMFSLADEISLAIDMLSYKAKESTSQLIFNPPDDLIQTYGNPIKFYRTICDLISNAIDSYENKKVDYEKKKIIITLSQTGNKIKISVKDSGCGIKKEDLDKIFQPLFTTKKLDRGTGLGLSICKNVIENDFDGEIRVYSEENKGSIFTVVIPIKKHIQDE